MSNLDTKKFIECVVRIIKYPLLNIHHFASLVILSNLKMKNFLKDEKNIIYCTTLSYKSVLFN